MRWVVAVEKLNLNGRGVRKPCPQYTYRLFCLNLSFTLLQAVLQFNNNRLRPLVQTETY